MACKKNLNKELKKWKQNKPPSVSCSKSTILNENSPFSLKAGFVIRERDVEMDPKLPVLKEADKVVSITNRA